MKPKEIYKLLRSEEPDTHSQVYKKFCLAIRRIKRKERVKVIEMIEKGEISRTEANKVRELVKNDSRAMGGKHRA